MKISVVVIAKDSIRTIRECLESLRSFEDVVVYDNGSTDGTQAVCAEYPNVHLVEGEFLGFGPTKRLASTYARYDWIFSLDSDEIVTTASIKTLQDARLDARCVYTIRRVNYYRDREIRHAWSGDVLPRIFCRTHTQISEHKVHEGVITKGMQVRALDVAVKHLRYTTISEFILKADKYSTLFAEHHAGKRGSSPLQALLRSGVAFLRKYIFKLGFLDGYPGLILAYSNMIENFYKYMKLYELNLELEKKAKAQHQKQQ
jgi:glycosyltransferase involved in cell wall biosynthesis